MSTSDESQAFVDLREATDQLIRDTVPADAAEYLLPEISRMLEHAYKAGAADARLTDTADRFAAVVRIPDDAWESGGPEDGDTNLLTQVSLNGHAFHLEAWRVKPDAMPQELDGIYPQHLTQLSGIYDPGDPYQTVPIGDEGHEYIVVMYPHGN